MKSLPPDPVAAFLAHTGQAPTPIHRYRPYWAKRFGIAPFLPMSRAEMDQLGWDACEVILVTGDAYVDHPSFGITSSAKRCIRSLRAAMVSAGRKGRSG